MNGPIPMESGPNGGFVHPFMLLALAGYPIASPLHPSLAAAVSTGRAIAGVAGTAMSQLSAQNAGIPHQLVFFDLTRSR